MQKLIFIQIGCLHGLGSSKMTDKISFGASKADLVYVFC
jgi:hypothetical protein